MIDGDTRIIAHIGFPTSVFKSPAIYNPYFESLNLPVAVVPFGVKAQDAADALPAIFRMTNVMGALVTMPHKVAVVPLLDEVSETVRVAGSANAVRIGVGGRTYGGMFDGEGFVRGVLRKGRRLEGESALVVGAGGVGSAIAASLARAGVARLMLFDADGGAADRLASRIAAAHPGIKLATGSADPYGHGVVVNATPLGMAEGDPLPVNVDRLAPHAFVGEVVMRREMTDFLLAARARGCVVQTGLDMLFEQIPAYLDFFGLPPATPETLRFVARLPERGA